MVLREKIKIRPLLWFSVTRGGVRNHQKIKEPGDNNVLSDPLIEVGLLFVELQNYVHYLIIYLTFFLNVGGGGGKDSEIRFKVSLLGFLKGEASPSIYADWVNEG